MIAYDYLLCNIQLTANQKLCNHLKTHFTLANHQRLSKTDWTIRIKDGLVFTRSTKRIFYYCRVHKVSDVVNVSESLRTNVLIYLSSSLFYYITLTLQCLIGLSKY